MADRIGLTTGGIWVGLWVLAGVVIWNTCTASDESNPRMTQPPTSVSTTRAAETTTTTETTTTRPTTTTQGVISTATGDTTTTVATTAPTTSITALAATTTTIPDYFSESELAFLDGAALVLNVEDHEYDEFTNEIAHGDAALRDLARKAVNTWWDYCLAAWLEASELVPDWKEPGWSTSEVMAQGWDRVLENSGIGDDLFLVAVAAAWFLCPEGDPSDWDGYPTGP